MTKQTISTQWSKNLAYAVGLIVSDGNMSPDGRHVTFTSKDFDLIQQFLLALNIPSHHVGRKSRGRELEKKYFVVQIGDVNFYRFLLKIGVMQNKSKILQEVRIPKNIFSHFVRGEFDGDGTSYSYYDPRWKSSHMIYTAFVSASPIFLAWLQKRLADDYAVHGKISAIANRVQQLRYAKKASRKLFRMMYKNADNIYLKRKYLKLSEALAILPSVQEKNARVEKLVDSSA